MDLIKVECMFNIEYFYLLYVFFFNFKESMEVVCYGWAHYPDKNYKNISFPEKKLVNLSHVF